MRVRKVGSVKIGREKIREFIYPRVRLPQILKNWIDQKAIVYLAEIDGQELIILSRSELAKKVRDISQLANEFVSISQLEQYEKRFKRIEEAIEKLTELISTNKPENKQETTEKNGLGRIRTGDLRLVRATS